jgi:hypothetical protein
VIGSESRESPTTFVASTLNWYTVPALTAKQVYSNTCLSTCSNKAKDPVPSQ